MGKGAPDCKPAVVAAVAKRRSPQETRAQWRANLSQQKEAPAVGDLTAGVLSRRSICHGYEGKP